MRPDCLSPLICVLLSFRGCEYLECSCPVGLAISRDYMVYICAMHDTLMVRQIDGSQSKFPLYPGPNKESSDGIYCARVCSDDGLVVQDQSENVTRYSKDGEFIWRMNRDTASPIMRFCLDSSDFLYAATSDQVKVNPLTTEFFPPRQHIFMHSAHTTFVGTPLPQHSLLGGQTWWGSHTWRDPSGNTVNDIHDPPQAQQSEVKGGCQPDFRPAFP